MSTFAKAFYLALYFVCFTLIIYDVHRFSITWIESSKTICYYGNLNEYGKHSFKSQIEKLNRLVSDIQAKVEYEIKSNDTSSIDISFQNILTGPDDFDAKIDESFTLSAINESLHTMFQAIKKIQEIIHQANMTLIQN